MYDKASVDTFYYDSAYSKTVGHSNENCFTLRITTRWRDFLSFKQKKENSVSAISKFYDCRAGIELA